MRKCFEIAFASFQFVSRPAAVVVVLQTVTTTSNTRQIVKHPTNANESIRFEIRSISIGAALREHDVDGVEQALVAERAGRRDDRSRLRRRRSALVWCDSMRKRVSDVKVSRRERVECIGKEVNMHCEHARLCFTDAALSTNPSASILHAA
jgi:hypothetical protein